MQRIPTMKTQNISTMDHHNTGKGTVPVPKDLQLLPAKHTPHPLTLDSLTQKTAHGSHKSWDKWHLVKKHSPLQTTTIVKHGGPYSSQSQYTNIFQTLNCFTMCWHYICILQYHLNSHLKTYQGHDLFIVWYTTTFGLLSIVNCCNTINCNILSKQNLPLTRESPIQPFTIHIQPFQDY